MSRPCAGSTAAPRRPARSDGLACVRRVHAALAALGLVAARRVAVPGSDAAVAAAADFASRLGDAAASGGDAARVAAAVDAPVRTTAAAEGAAAGETAAAAVAATAVD